MRPVFLNSLPKAGTNLGAKCLDLAGYKFKASFASNRVIAKNPRALLRRIFWSSLKRGYIIGIDTPVEVSRPIVDGTLKKLKHHEYCSSHIGYTKDILWRCQELGIAVIVMVRDPRSVLSSSAHYLFKSQSHVLHDYVVNLDQKDLYRAILYGGKLGSEYLQPLKDRCLSMQSWIRDDYVFNLRFEDLVGSQGGGDNKIQKKTIVRLFDYLNISTCSVDYLTKELFGPGKHTFRSGQIHSWKEEIPLSLREEVSKELACVIDSWGYSV